MARLTASERDDPERIVELRLLISRKRLLRDFYQEAYRRYAECLGRCSQSGKALELGSGGGFAKDILPDLVTSDTLRYHGVDQVIDARKLRFADGSLRAILVLNVFHHIPDVETFLHETERCLTTGGMVRLLDIQICPLRTLQSRCGEMAVQLQRTTFRRQRRPGRIAFKRDYKRFHALYPNLELNRYQPHTPFGYWLSGGLKKWFLLPAWSSPFVKRLDSALTSVAPGLNSFVDIEIVKQ